MMKNKLVALVPGGISHNEILCLFTGHLPEEQIACVGLLDNLDEKSILRLYAPEAREKTVTLRADRPLVLSAQRVEAALQKQIERLEEQGVETLLLLWDHAFENLSADRAVLLDPHRMLPAMVEVITRGHQPGVLVAYEETLSIQQRKWRRLSPPPVFAVARPDCNDALTAAGLTLLENGAEVLLLDSLAYHPRHRDYLQKRLGIPVLLSHLLIAKLAAELVM